MVLYGLIVLNKGGLTIYSKIVGIELDLESSFIGSFLSAIQSFAKKFEKNKQSCIEEIILQNFKIKFRQFEILTFIGVTDPQSDSVTAELILEYMISAFLSKFKKLLSKKKLNVIVPSKFVTFDNFFTKYRNSSEKELKKWLEERPPSLLQGIVNKLIDFFPISQIRTLNPQKLTVIGKKLIWIAFDIKPEEEMEFFERLKKLTITIYGEKVFKSIQEEVKKKITV